MSHNCSQIASHIRFIFFLLGMSHNSAADSVSHTFLPLLLRNNLACKPKQKREISYHNLPAGTKDRFKYKVIPLSLETTGTLKPWAILEDQTIIEIWNLVYGADHHIDNDDVECEHFLVAKTLVSG